MSNVGAFDYSLQYNFIKRTTPVGAGVYFSQEKLYLPCQIVNLTLYGNDECLKLINNELLPSTKSKISGLSEVHDDSEDFEFKIVSTIGTKESVIFAKGWVESRKILLLLDNSSFRFVQKHGMLQVLLSCLSIYPETKPYINAFLSLTKGGIVLDHKSSDFLKKAFETFAKSPSGEFDESALKSLLDLATLTYTEQEIGFLICILTLGMSKNLSAESNYNIWLSNRKKGWEGTLQITLSKSSIPLPFVQDFRNILDFYPEVRPVILQCLLAVKHNRGIRHILDLLALTQLTTVSFILNFIEAPRKTMAHVSIHILKDLKKFKTHFQEVKNKYNDNWIYFKFYEPESNLFSYRQLPNLTYAAYEYERKSGRTKNYNALTPPPLGKTIETLVNTPLVTSYAMGDLDDYKDILEYMHLDIEEVKKITSKGIQI